MLSLVLRRAVGLLESCLAAVSELRLRSKDEITVRRAIKPLKRSLQSILEEHLLAEVGQALPMAKREVQVVLEDLSDAADYSRNRGNPNDGKLEGRLERAESLLRQLIDEITDGKPKEGRIEPIRARTHRPFALGYKGCAPPLRRVERGVPNNGKPKTERRRSHSFVSACS